MAICNIKLILLITSLLLSNNEVEGRRRRSGTKDNDINKPITKSIQVKTIYGDIYDCIDFYKQHAFGHPLLQNHSYNFQVIPSSYPKGLNTNGASERATKTLNIWSNAKGCPVGTVLIRAQKHSKTSRFTPTISGHVHAVVRTTNPNRKYNGVGANIALYNPHLFRTAQYSSGHMKIQNGGDSIEVGWTAGQSHCFNTQCPGFIVVDNETPLDYVFDNISRQGGPQWSIYLFVHRDAVTGDWWLNFGKNNIQIGFWPKRIFTGLGDLASYIDWGGEVYSPPNEPAPYMGGGHLPFGDTKYDAYCRNMTFVNEAREIVDATDTEHYVDNIHYYGVDDWWGGKGDWGHLMVFGGGLWRNKN